MTLKRYTSVSLGEEKGMALVVGLLLVVVLLLIGTTAVMTSTTDIRISSNYKSSNQAFYVTEAGAEEARGRLKADAANPISDSHPTNSNWRAYIGVVAKAQGKGYDSGNSLHVRLSSLQTALDYTVRIAHRTNAGGQILYWGDADGNGIPARTINPTSPTGLPNPNIYLVTGYGAASGASKTIDVEMTRPLPVTVPAALYVEATTTVQGTSTNIIGVDGCGGSNLPGIVTTLGSGTVTQNGNPSITGAGGTTPNITYNGTNMDVQAMIDSLKGSANFSYNVASDTQTGTQSPGPGDGWGTPTPGATLQNPSSCSARNIVRYNTNGTYIRLSGGVSGCGILIVEGNLEISGNFSWYGPVLVSGSVIFTGGGNKNITGAVVAGGSADADLVGGNANIVYCSAAVNNQTQNMPLRNLSWIERQ